MRQTRRQWTNRTKDVKFDDLGDRMKRQEAATRTLLPRRTYTMVRVDGRCFHGYTRGLGRPFDATLMADMHAMTQAICEEMTGCIAGYTQSDEASFLLSDLEGRNSQPFFDGNVQKITSITAALATAAFGIRRIAHDAQRGYDGPSPIFDSRTFTLPSTDEVLAYFLWRQMDATRNALQMAAQTFYSHKDLHGKKRADLNEMLFQKGVNFNDYPTHFKRGAFVIKTMRPEEGADPRTGITCTTRPAAWTVVEDTPKIGTKAGQDWLANFLPRPGKLDRSDDQTT